MPFYHAKGAFHLLLQILTDFYSVTILKFSLQVKILKCSDVALTLVQHAKGMLNMHTAKVEASLGKCSVSPPPLFTHATYRLGRNLRQTAIDLAPVNS